MNICSVSALLLSCVDFFFVFVGLLVKRLFVCISLHSSFNLMIFSFSAIFTYFFYLLLVIRATFLTLLLLLLSCFRNLLCNLFRCLRRKTENPENRRLCPCVSPPQRLCGIGKGPPSDEGHLGNLYRRRGKGSHCQMSHPTWRQTGGSYHALLRDKTRWLRQ